MSQTHTDQQQDQQTQQQYKQQEDEQAQQALYDQSFLAQIAQGQSAPTVDWAREYFDSIELQVRSARRVAEVAALGQIEQRITARTAMMVRQQLLNEPTFVEQVAKRLSTMQQQQGSTR